MNDAGLGDIVKIERIVRWLKSVWARAFFAVAGLVIGFYMGVTIVESRIIGDCRYLNSFRIDHLSYSCNRKVNDQ